MTFFSKIGDSLTHGESDTFDCRAAGGDACFFKFKVQSCKFKVEGTTPLNFELATY
jgi:hypothetical protein